MFMKKRLSKKSRKRILNDARDELLRILKETEIKKFIEKALSHE